MRQNIPCETCQNSGWVYEGVDRGTISKIKNGKIWKRQADAEWEREEYRQIIIDDANLEGAA